MSQLKCRQMIRLRQKWTFFVAGAKVTSRKSKIDPVFVRSCYLQETPELRDQRPIGSRQELPAEKGNKSNQIIHPFGRAQEENFNFKRHKQLEPAFVAFICLSCYAAARGF